MVWATFEQEGEFVDFETLDIFADEFRSSGATATGHVMAGLDISLNKRFILTGEGRYSWASLELDRDFVGFEDLDLAGFRATVGISARF